MSAEHLLNDDLPDDTRQSVSGKLSQREKEVLLGLDVLHQSRPEQDKPSYYDLMTLRLEAGARLARSLKTLVDANVIKVSKGEYALDAALRIAEEHWADICNGLTPVRGESGEPEFVANLPACIEAFRIIVMEHAQRNALELECRNMVDHVAGFKLLTKPQVLHIDNKHVCDGDCDHASKTL